MAEIFSIAGRNPIPFDQVSGPYTYVLAERGKPPRGLSEPLTRQEVLGQLSKLPLEIRPHVMMHGLSIITFEITITGTTDADMEAKRHDLTETLEDTTLYFSTQGGRGTRAELLLKADGAVGTSYKSIFYGVCEEQAGRDVLGAFIKEHRLYAVKVTLYCEPYWRPASAVELGPNEIKTPSFERGATLADNWTEVGNPITTIEATIVLDACGSQKVVTDNASLQGVRTGSISHATLTSAVAYAWVYRTSPGDDIAVEIWDTSGAGAVVATALLSTGGWRTEIAGGVTWSRLVVSSNALVAGRIYYLRIVRRLADATQITTYYVDKTFWKFGTIVCPDEWIDYYVVYNHEDTDVDHINHMDLADLKGDVDAPIRLKVEQLSADDYHCIHAVEMARRTRGTPCKFAHILEAENAGIKTNWPAVPDTECSNANKVVEGAGQVTGSVRWTISSNLDDMRGRFKVISRVKGTPSTTKFWVAIETPNQLIFTGDKKAASTSSFAELELGDFAWPPQDIPAGRSCDLIVQLYYWKSEADVVQCDFVLLEPVDESVMRIMCLMGWVTGLGESLEADPAGITNNGIGYGGVFTSSDLYKFPLGIRGNLTIRPDKFNRIIFHWVYKDSGADTKWFVRNADAPAVQAEIAISYLPQYISPLE